MLITSRRYNRRARPAVSKGEYNDVSRLKDFSVNTFHVLLTDLPTEILTLITAGIDPATVFALKYANKYLHGGVPRPSHPASDLMASAAADGDLQAVMWLHSMGCTGRTCSDEIYETAARNGHTDVLKWLGNNGYRIHRSIVIDAAFSGKVEIFGWLKSMGYTANNISLAIAAALGHADLMKWFLKLTGIKFHFTQMIGIAAATGQIEVLKVLLATGVKHNLVIEEIAAYNGHLDCVKWLLSDDNTICRANPSRARAGAVAGGRAEIVRWIDSSRLIWFGSRDRRVFVPVSYDMKSPCFVLNRYR